MKITALICFFSLLLPVITNIESAQAASYYTQTQSSQKQMTTKIALAKLVAGNQRFITDTPRKRDFLQQIKMTQKAQYPFAIIINCIDARSPPEILFDQGIGDIFVARVAGNVINNDILASAEYATKVIHAKLIVVMGHTNCGAIRAACENVKLGHITQLVKQIQPAVRMVEAKTHNKNCSDPALIDKIAKQNVLLVLKQIKDKSPIIKKLLQQKKITLIGAMHDISTGKVVFIDPAE